MSSSLAKRRAGRRLLLWYGLWSCLMVLGLSLGLWQWQRAADKRELLADIASAPTLEAPQVEPPLGAEVSISGEYLAEETLFLDNRTREGRVGVAPLTPLRDADGRLWLVERGFLPTGASREAPSVDTPEGRVRLQGRWQPAGDSPPLFGANREGARLQRIELSAWAALGEFAYPGWLHLEQGPGRLTPWWQPNVLPPERHLGYAFQWWGLALAGLVVMIIGARRLRRDRSSVMEETRP